MQTAIAQFVHVSGIRCSFSKRNVVPALGFWQSWKMQNNSTCLSKTFLNEKRSCFEDWSSLPQRTPQWPWKISGLVRFPNCFLHLYLFLNTICYKTYPRRSTPHADPKDLHSRVVFTFALQALQALTKKKTNEQNLDYFTGKRFVHCMWMFPRMFTRKIEDRLLF